MDRLKEMLAEDMAKAEESKKRGGDSPGEVYGTADGRIVVTAKSIKKALERGSEVLGESIMNLDYEIVEHGSSGFLGIGGKPYKLIIGTAAAYVGEYAFEQAAEGGGFSGDNIGFESMQHIEPADKNGEAKVTVRKSGIFITVFPPKGSGQRATLEQANSELFMKSIMNFDKDLIEQTVEAATGEPVKIGDWKPNKMYDSRASIEVSPDEMKAFCTVVKPEKYGRVLEVEDVKAHLELNGVKFGILEDAIANMLEKELYGAPVMVAQGKPVEIGKDAVINYNFRTETDKINLKEEEGRVDFHNLELVQNVVVGQVLATKEDATFGEAGRTVTNRRIETKSGKDQKLLAGKNTQLSADGLELTSTINGQVVFLNNKIHVEPVYEVHGDVNLETGNIVFLGTVVVTGSIEDGFSVKAAGNVEIRGNVGKAVIEAEGNIFVKQGILGKDEADIKAGNDIMAKFVEHAKISAGNDVVIMEHIMHSFVDAGKRVLCIGKRAMIVGGRIRAREEVNAKEIGSKVSTETVVEVGIDPNSREKLNQLEEEKRDSTDNVNKLAKDIITLQNQKGSGSLPEEKENMLQGFIRNKADLEARIEEINEETNEIRTYLNMLETKGKICASKLVHPGVVVWVKNANLPVKDNFKFVTFVQEGGHIKVNPYEDYEGFDKRRRTRR